MPIRKLMSFRLLSWKVFWHNLEADATGLDGGFAEGGLRDHAFEILPHIGAGA